jgi:hypothetical protein
MKHDVVAELKMQETRFFRGRLPGNGWPEYESPEQWLYRDCPRCQSAFAVIPIRLWGYRCTKCGHVPNYQKRRKEAKP